jgi:hypothetical protein
MRYMFLVYSNELSDHAAQEAVQQAAREHHAVMAEAASRGVLHGADPLKPTATATTVRKKAGKVLITDGPFAETKEHLAGYYVLECRDLDDAIEWAKKIPTACFGGDGSVEIRPIQEMQVSASDADAM